MQFLQGWWPKSDELGSPEMVKCREAAQIAIKFAGTRLKGAQKKAVRIDERPKSREETPKVGSDQRSNSVSHT
ncbi:MAG: hypothetical protein CTY20_07145 [Hyphomicrobium sp.]|nr:MAG: hypothetical protein CTY20_07145 [Hyphomicrobium sp.]